MKYVDFTSKTWHVNLLDCLLNTVKIFSLISLIVLLISVPEHKKTLVSEIAN